MDNNWPFGNVATVLLNNVSATGNGPDVFWQGGDCVWSVFGTFGGTTAKLQSKKSDGSYTDTHPDLTATAAKDWGAHLAPGTYRAVLTGGAPVNVFCELRLIT